LNPSCIATFTLVQTTSDRNTRKRDTKPGNSLVTLPHIHVGGKKPVEDFGKEEK
jgi:hypothetical protein